MTPLELSLYARPASLRDGEQILVRAIRPSDKTLLLDHFGRLGAESVRHRFFGAKKTLSDGELAYFTDLDFAEHVALAATLPGPGGERMIGVARYIRIDAPGPTSAEAAFAVVDEHQGRGVGTLLLEHLARVAREQGVEELHADVMGDNTQMLNVFTEGGFAVREALESGVYKVVFPTRDS